MRGGIHRYPMGDPLGLQYTDAVAKKLKGGLPKDAFGTRLYDTIRLKAGAAVPVTAVSLFQIPLGQNTAVVNAPTEVYPKSFVDTNLTTAGLLPAGYAFYVRSIQAILSASAATDTTYASSGAGTELPTDPTAAAAVAAANLISAVTKECYLRTYVGTKEYEQGLLLHFPTKYGLSGFAGFGVSTNFEGVTNNGFGREWELPIEREIPPLTNFRIDLQFIQTLTITRNITIQVALEGILLRPVQ